jgi:protocatechuate 3,4-dioxygenase beta subunit
MTDFRHLPRRVILKAMAASSFIGMLPSIADLSHAQNPLALTPACDDADESTPAQTEGPYFTPNSPERAQLREQGMPGTPILLAGMVLTRSCVPIHGALVELWHADDAGNYDNEGYKLRGHQFTGDHGIYRFDTIVPGLYPGRTRHFHAKFQAPENPALTTQFYFPDEPGNSSDGIFDPRLLLKISTSPGLTARLDVVLDLD